MIFITHTGDGYLFILAPVLTYYFSPEIAFQLIPALFSGIRIERLFYYIIKRGFKRDRPFQVQLGINNLVNPSDKFSFPSGHTSAAFLLAVQFSHQYPLIAPLLFIWATMVGISRVYLSVHYPTDILAGACLGSIIGIGFI